MERRRLGRTNFPASVISLGTVEIGMPYGLAAEGEQRQVGEAEAARLLHGALDLGINVIDTARVYGESEAIIGRTLAARRGEYFLATKTPVFEDAADRGSRVIASLEESLRQLRTDVVDLLQLHTSGTAWLGAAELADALDELRRRALIRFTGASVYGEEAALAAIRSNRFDCVQIAWSALDRRPETAVLPAAREYDVGVIVRSVLLKGVLTHRSRGLPEHLRPLKEASAALEGIAHSRGLELPELAYRYVLGQSCPLTALVGARSLEEAQAAAAYAGRGPLPGEIVARIREVTVEREELLHPGAWGTG
ncbi:MAG: aldo/keto reductase [Bryobacterales bacterium]|nr:aldo/keto reductase [Bryobacterales bacterium]